MRGRGIGLRSAESASSRILFSPVAAVVLVICLGMILSTSGAGPRGPVVTAAGSGRTSLISTGLRGVERAAGNCSTLSLSSVRVSPQSVSVSASATQTFTATALSACGTTLTNTTHFSWRLSSSSVGSLGSTVGASVVYTACLAPMDGVLHLVGTYNGTSLTANATIKIAGGGSDGFSGAPESLPGNESQDSSTGKIVGIALVVILVMGGVAVFLWGQKQERSKPPS